MSNQFNPDWSKIPKEYYWAAVDADGAAFAYTFEIHLGETEWILNGTEDRTQVLDYVLLGHGFDATAWKNTLVKRPKQ